MLISIPGRPAPCPSQAAGLSAEGWIPKAGVGGGPGLRSQARAGPQWALL